MSDDEMSASTTAAATAAASSSSASGPCSSSVRVAVRIRPQLPREIIDACKTCISKTPGEPQTWLGSNKAFTYDFVYEQDSRQEDIYRETAHDLIEGCFEGYNATVLAYGQTGSGKTYTMGTGFDLAPPSPDNLGIIPRAVRQLFEGIRVRQEEAKQRGALQPEFKVTTQFMELYNEEVNDLFDSCKTGKGGKGGAGIRIHEDANGNIYTIGMTSRTVHSEDETMQCLKAGAFNRTTASTNMNDQSSRSHAIFTICLQQQRQATQSNAVTSLADTEVTDGPGPGSGDLETLTAKFHFVDLAGSERLKRTGATGDRAKEGISINCGLLALGNVISALGDTSRKALHVPYRDSKLTRLLQDSLGGNSRTLMIACVSPSDRDFMETLNSLKYANRARNIRNKVTANQDKTSRTIMALRQEIQNLQLELMEYKQGKRLVSEDGVETTNDMYHENTMLGKENQNLRTRIKAMQETIDVLTAKNGQLLAEKELGKWIGGGGGDGEAGIEAGADMKGMVENYMTQIEELRSKLCESENMCEQLRKESARNQRRLSQTMASPGKSLLAPGLAASPWAGGAVMEMSMEEEDSGYSVQELLDMAKKDLAKKKKEEKRRRRSKPKKSSGDDEDKDDDSADDEDDDEEEDDVEDDDDDLGSDDEDESDTDTEESSDNNKVAQSGISEELVELTSEISLKQKLIEELETSQKRLTAMKQQYENKLIALHNKISVTEEERDKVLKNMMGAGKSSAVAPEQLSKIKQDYKDKLERLQSEVKKLQTAKKEHAKLLRSQTQYERQVQKLKGDVSDMKRNKVRLVQKMKEESNRHREEQMRRNKELNQMRKVTRKNEGRIRSLEAEKRMKENILKRKTEEVTALRRSQRRVSAIGRNAKNDRFSEKSAKAKWKTVEKKISKVALNRQAISQMENDMDRWLKEREKLSRKLERMAIKRKRLAAEKGDSTLVDDLDDQIENLKANVSYLHENIVECQQQIVEMEQAENPEEEEEEAIAKIINVQDIGLEESRYLLSKLLSMTVNQCCQATQKDSQVKELENKIGQINRQSTMTQQLLQHMIEQQDLEVYDLMLEAQGDEESESDLDDVANAVNTAAMATSGVNFFVEEGEGGGGGGGVGSDSSLGRQKARRRMTTKEDLLFNDMDMPSPTDGPLSSSLQPTSLPMAPPAAPGLTTSSSFTRSLSFTKPRSDLLMRSRSFVKPSSGQQPSANGRHGHGYGHGYGGSNIPNIMTQSVGGLNPVYQPSPVMGRRTLDQHPRSTSPRGSTLNLRKYNSGTRLNEEYGSSPPGSPPSYRRQGSRDETGKNVFNRLLAGTKIGESSSLPGKGTIHPYKGRSMAKAPLVCAQVAEGHNRPILSVYATDTLMFSGSKDRTVKVWDLARHEEIRSLDGHANNVNVVKYSEASGLAFTVSSAFIKVWDLRSASCVKTLSSSGLTTNGPVQLSTGMNRTVAMPPGETLINDIALSPSGQSLFSAAADKVRIWDLRKFHSIGKLSGGHQAAVMCLTTGSAPTETSGDFVITGSKDHSIKVFNVTEGSGGVVPAKMNLYPPHYDGIECLAYDAASSTLFSASRDTCIKKWNIQTQELVRSCNNAHKDWICGLSFLPGGQVLVSGCRAGYLKLWSAETCSLLGEMKAHNSTINAIATNSGMIFTGSNDGSIGMWRRRGNFDKSPDSDVS